MFAWVQFETKGNIGRLNFESQIKYFIDYNCIIKRHFVLD